MAYRNMDQIIKRTNEKKIIPDKYDINILEINELYCKIQEGANGAWDAITSAFVFGFAMGCRATKAGKTKGI